MNGGSSELMVSLSKASRTRTANGALYLDNTRLPGQSGTEFRAHLSALAKRGYQPIDNFALGKALIDAA